MRQRDKFEIPGEMAKVRRDIEEWRSTRTKRCRLPDWLWEAAAALGRTHGIYRAARALHVSYESLKRRVVSGNGGRRPTDRMGQTAVPFVELRPAPLAATPAPAHGSEVELVGVQGERMVIRLAANQHLDLPALAKAFQGRWA
jgi:hypothetical protein